MMYIVGGAIPSVSAHLSPSAWTRGNWFGPTFTAWPSSWFLPTFLNKRTAAETASSTGFARSKAALVCLSEV